jgi:hypothetical protein
VKEGDRVFMLIAAKPTWEIGDRGTLVHVYQPGSQGYGDVVIELDRLRGTNARRIQVNRRDIRLFTALDHMAEIV